MKNYFFLKSQYKIVDANTYLCTENLFERSDFKKNKIHYLDFFKI